MRIHKYPVLPNILTMMPEGARPLSVGEQSGQIVCWALVDPMDRCMKGRRIAGYGTGHETPEAIGTFIGTVQMQSGLVFHFFDQGVGYPDREGS